uniref:Fibroblast growth factor n=1 Tax=Zosterops lateralis melanops TaxID=1220523 RepID=A0A8D2QVM4_ZOSLA
MPLGVRDRDAPLSPRAALRAKPRPVSEGERLCGSGACPEPPARGQPGRAAAVSPPESRLHPDGRVDGAHDASPLSILEIFAVSQGIVGIRGVFSNKFLAMSKKGKLHASARFTVDCHFRERFQENSYNTYASAVHRSPRSGRQWYVALNKRGKAKRGCSPRARPQHVSTHFLPRFWQPQPPELAFTVALPEKKPPPPKPKVVPSPPRKNPGPVKYRLKFRFG